MKLDQLRQECCEADKMIDVYAFGITLLEIMTRQPAWGKGILAKAIMLNVHAGQRPTVPTDTVETFAKDYLAFVLDILHASWRQDATLRPTFAELVKAFESRSFGSQ